MPGRPHLVTDGEDLDLLATWDTTEVPVVRLRERMLLVDVDLGTPVAILDHRTRRRRGLTYWLIEHLDDEPGRPRWTEVPFAPGATVTVATRPHTA